MLAPGTTLPGEAYITLGQSISEGLNLWVQTQTPSGGIVYGNAIRLNERFALTVNPFTHSGGGYTFNSVGNGNDFNTAPGDTRSVASVFPYSNSAVDASIIEFGGAPLPGHDISFASPPAFGSKVYCVGFGNFALQGGSIINQDGNIRGFEMVMDDFVHNGLDPEYYASAFVSTSVMASLTLPGGALANDSGGMVVNEAGAVISFIKSASGGTSGIASVNFVTVTNPLFTSWIDFTATITPEPTSATLALLGLACMSGRRKRS